MESIKLGITVTTSLCSVLLIYHKFVMAEIDKKVDQRLYDKEVDYMKIQTKYNYSNLEKRIDDISKDMKSIKEFILKTK
ncbi:MAG: hypothetical protein ACRC51_05945 [Cetobacterium sp.]